MTLAREMAAALDAPLFAATTTRLLLDLNRSIGAPHFHSEFVRALPLAERQRIVADHYRPHHEPIETWVRSAVAAGAVVLHVASHSFTPVLDGVERAADVGFLYDPRRPGEVVFARRWLEALRRLRPDLRLRRNYPYLGKSDGLTFRMRRRYPPARYVGVELEVNQRFVQEGGPAWPRLREALIESLREALDTMAPTPPIPLASAG